MGELNIIFDNEQSAFLPGMTVSGQVIIEIRDAPITAKGLLVNFMGEAKVHWAEHQVVQNDRVDNSGQICQSTLTRSDRRETRKNYSGDDLFLNEKIDCIGEGGERVLMPGVNTFQFTYNLPHTIPSSFEGDYGNIRYKATAVLKVPCWGFDTDASMKFKVVNHLDLNTNPSWAAPVYTKELKTFCCFCCVSGPLEIDVALPTMGAASGQTLQPTLDVQNNSGTKINSINIALMQGVLYRASCGKIKYSEKIVDTTYLGSIESGESCTFENGLSIPMNMPVSTLNDYGIIAISYYLKAEFSPKGIYRAFRVVLPVVMGTIPLK